jgi:hypothetical protein
MQLQPVQTQPQLAQSTTLSHTFRKSGSLPNYRYRSEDSAPTLLNDCRQLTIPCRFDAGGSQRGSCKVPRTGGPESSRPV